MFNRTPHPHASHSLRFVAFLLRVALGVYIFFLGFNNSGLLLEELHQGPLTKGLYLWLTSPHNTAASTLVAQWIFFVIGVCLVVGFATRIVSVVGVGLMALIYTAHIRLPVTSVSPLVNDQLIIMLCFLILIVSKAGKYIGLDKFMHFSLRGKK